MHIMKHLSYLLDTNICIYIAKQKPQKVFKKFQELSFGEAGMSTITYGELLYGAEKSQYREKTIHVLEELAHYIPPLLIPVDASSYYGEIRAHLEKKGECIGNNDLWIASHALALNTTLITNNVKEFSRIPNLNIENWV